MSAGVTARTRRARALVVTLVVAGLFASACASPGGDITVVRSDRVGGTSSGSDDGTTTNTGSDGNPDETANTTVSPDAEYEVVPGVVDFGDVEPSHPEYDGFLTTAIADIEQFWAESYPAAYDSAWEPLAGGVYAASPRRTDPIPGCGESESTYDDVADNAFYCFEADFIAYDDFNLLPSLVDALGREAVAVVLAHEFGHAVQWRTDSFDQPTILLEQQADCFAGAWTAHVANGDSDLLAFDDAGVRGGLLAMLSVADPIDGSGLADPQAHGSGFDRVGAFQDGFTGGVERCTTFFTENRIEQLIELAVDPFDLAGNLPLFDPTGQGSDIVTLLPASLEAYWTALTTANKVAFTPPTFVGFDAVGPYPSCSTVADDDWVWRVAYCPDDNTIYWDMDAAADMLDEPFSGDMSVGYLYSTAYSDAVQTALQTSRSGERRALMNDCLTGTWTGEIKDTDSEPIFLSAGDLDEAVMTAIVVADERSTDDIVGSAFEKVDAFRAGVLGGLEECQAQFG
ncbi:MAG: hypothetical protein RLZ04_1070 [Actinomycetota bacterium]